MDWIPDIDPSQWVDAISDATTTLPFWFVVVAVIIAFLRWGLAPLIRAMKGKE